jgi:hypothetical protein
MCTHCASTPHRQPTTPQDGAPSPTLSLADEFLFHFPMRQPLFRRSLARPGRTLIAPALPTTQQA